MPKWDWYSFKCCSRFPTDPCCLWFIQPPCLHSHNYWLDFSVSANPMSPCVHDRWNNHGHSLYIFSARTYWAGLLVNNSGSSARSTLCTLSSGSVEQSRLFMSRERILQKIKSLIISAKNYTFRSYQHSKTNMYCSFCSSLLACPFLTHGRLVDIMTDTAHNLMSSSAC